MGKYLKFYKQYAVAGKIPYRETPHTAGGLCSIFHRDKLFGMLTPTVEEGGGCWYWGHGEEFWDVDNISFTPLRQNIVLFMAAMNGEL